jgi:hypothetical protein
MATKTNTTPRSYTLRLSPVSLKDADNNGKKKKELWERLFQTHHAVCEGARVFGELFLNLRGGLSPDLAQDDDPELRRGRRRVLTLGWLSVEDDRGAENHPYRIKKIDKGKSLSNPQAQQLLKDILQEKGVTCQNLIGEWWNDCQDALTARVRTDSVWINRAAAFAAMQPPPSSEEARKILFRLCGEKFSTLRLPEQVTGEEAADDLDPEDNEDTKPSKILEGTEEPADPSNKSRGVYGDLFGGDKDGKLKREADKNMFAKNLMKFLRSNQDEAVLTTAICDWRKTFGPLDTTDPVKYPVEVISSSGAPTAVAKRYRKLLVHLRIWPQSTAKNGENGRIPSNILKLDKTHTRALIEYVIEACEKQAPGTVRSDDESEIQDQATSTLRVFNPEWGQNLQETVARQTGLASNNKTATEFLRLMFALAARRMSQTHTWMKRSEVERNKVVLKARKAENELRELGFSGDARKWLEAYEKSRSDETGALNDFRITPRAVSEFSEIVEKWKTCSTENERVEVIDEVQKKSEKFGDANLFHALAEEEFDNVNPDKVWHDAQQNATAEILIHWSRLRKAQDDERRLKIPRYCHPDPFYHPAFCEYGGTSKPKVYYSWRNDKTPQNPEPGNGKGSTQCLWLLLPNFQSGEVRPCPFRWQSKRLWMDFGGESGTKTPISRNDRLGRAAISHSLDSKTICRPQYPFSKDAKGWNARLQADRRNLEKLAGIWDENKRNWRDGGKKLLNLKWFLTFSPDLEIVGPLNDYAATYTSEASDRPFLTKEGEYAIKHESNNARKGKAKLILSRLPGLRILSVDLGHRYAAACAVWETLTSDKINSVCKTAGLGEPNENTLYLHIKTKNDKEGKAITTIYRRIGPDAIPDTGEVHLAPWARLDRQFLIKLQGEIEEARMASNDEILFVHNLEKELGIRIPLIDRMVAHGFGATEAKQKIRLEELNKMGWSPAGTSSGETSEDDDEAAGRKPSLSVDELISSAVNTIRLALRRHGDRARIAFAMTAPYKPMPGARKYFFKGATDASANDDEKTRRDKYIEFIQDALVLWHGLFSDKGWKDELAEEHWKAHIEKLPGYKAPEEIGEDASGKERKKKLEEKKTNLNSAAKVLAKDEPLRMKLNCLWDTRWREDDGQQAEVEKSSGTKKKNGTGWFARLRHLQNWIMPSSMSTTRHLGGLSLIRLATMTEFRRKIQVGFFTRLKPDGSKEEISEKYGQRSLDALEHLRENRVKQLASRIAESALGIGREHVFPTEKVPDKKCWCGKVHGKKDPKRPRARKDLKRPRERIIEDPRFAPCHAVVIEYLKNYKPDEIRSRRENRLLAAWRVAEVRKYLAEACQLNGLHLREVPAHYTSRQDSRTGAPGIRCQDVPVKDFVRQGGYLWKRIQEALDEKKKNDKVSAENRLLADIYSHWDEKAKTWIDAKGKWTLDQNGQWSQKNGAAIDPKKAELPEAVRIPQRGGEIFVSADSNSPASQGLQADLNAAANIGIKALLDPDWPGKWWYVPCNPTTFKPLKDKVGGSAAININTPLKEAQKNADESSEKKKKGGGKKDKSGEYINLWRDPSGEKLPVESGNDWQDFKSYWKDGDDDNNVEGRVIKILRKHSGLGGG